MGVEWELNLNLRKAPPVSTKAGEIMGESVSGDAGDADFGGGADVVECEERIVVGEWSPERVGEA